MGVLKDFDTSVVEHDKAVTDVTTRYNIIREGLSYSGCCTTSSCEGYRKNVICCRGFGNHLVNDDIVCGVPVCPCCKKDFVVETIMLYRCQATITVHGQQEESSAMLARGNDIVKLGQRNAKDGVLQSQRLVTVTAKPLNDSKCCFM